MTFRELDRRLRERLAGPLPGRASQERMAPRPRAAAAGPGPLRASGVLVLLYPIDGSPHLVLTVRGSLAQHAGQVALPGGRVEAGETIDQAVVREAREEVGVDPEALQILGALSPLDVPVSGYVLHPRVALAGERPAWRADPREVARILEVPLCTLGDPRTVQSEIREREGQRVVVPFFAVLGEKVWGATAMVLAELLEVAGGGQ